PHGLSPLLDSAALRAISISRWNSEGSDNTLRRKYRTRPLLRSITRPVPPDDPESGSVLPHVSTAHSWKGECPMSTSSLIGRSGSSAFRLSPHYSVDVAHGLVLLYGIGTKALPSWEVVSRISRTFD